MIADVLVPYQNPQSSCPLHTMGSVQNFCFMNQLKSNSQPFMTPNGATVKDAVGVAHDSLVRGPTGCNQIYLSQPTDSLGLSNIEFIIAPPDSGGNPQCSYFDTHSPEQCTVPMCDCTTRCMYDGSMPCNNGLTPQKVGPCLSDPSWNGWTMQGYQCTGVQGWKCDPTTGTCTQDPNGAYPTQSACQQACPTCPSTGYQIYIDKNGQYGCYRTSYQGIGNDCYGSDYCNLSPEYCICQGCENTNNNACNGGGNTGWNSSCSCDVTAKTCNNYCVDTLTTPAGAYQCTTNGYVQCTSPGGCSPPTIQVQGSQKYCTAPAGSTLVRDDAARGSLNSYSDLARLSNSWLLDFPGSL